MSTSAPPLTGQVETAIRLGVDFGGTKIAAATLDGGGRVLETRRVDNPGGYDAAVAAVRDLVDALSPPGTPIGLGGPGSPSPVTGLIRNANSTWLNGRNFGADLEAATGRPVRLANDANCFALSEATDGAAAGAKVVFGVIIGTGVGGGIVVDGKLVAGAGGVAAEWGHIPLPWMQPDEYPGPRCWCGLHGCMETWASGPALERDYGQGVRAPEIVARARSGEADARAALTRYVSRLGRGLAVICNVLDPDVIVLGGGMSNVEELYAELPAAIAPFLFTDQPETRVVRNRHGDASGVRGAAWLW